MPSDFIADTPLFTWVVLPALIFLARILDVSLSTIRIIYVARGLRRLAPLIGFFEILVWLLAIGQIFKNLHNPLCYLAYAAGFASGSYIGMAIADRLSLGKVILRVITRRSGDPLIDHLRAERYGVTVVDAEGIEGPVKVLFMVLEGKDLSHVIDTVKQFNPNAFYSVEDVRFVKEGTFPVHPRRALMPDMFRFLRKSK